MTAGPSSELVVVEGADARSYLDSQCAQDLSDLGVGDATWTLLLEPRGELVAVAAVRCVAADRIELEVPGGTGAGTVARLERFAIRATVAFRVADEPPVAPLFADELARIVAGVPGPAELERSLVAHALDPALRARCVSFTKGCYPGQELVARMESRHATPPYVLRGLAADGPVAAGDPIGDPSLEGAVTSVATDPRDGRVLALCVLHRRDAGAEPLVVRTGTGDVVAHLA